MSNAELVKRVEALEAEMARLRRDVVETPKEPWWKAIRGSFAGDPLFLEAMRLGREYRTSLRPKLRKPRKKGR